jgi:hypothetical protein
VTEEKGKTDELRVALARALGEARAAVARGQTPSDAVAKLRALAESAPPDVARDALAQIERIVSVHRARALVAPRPAQPAAPPRPRKPVLRSRPTLTGTLDVRRETRDGALVLAWESVPQVVEWEVRIGERDGPRGAYAVRETRTLPAGETSAELPETFASLQVHVLGRDRGGRLVRRAVAAALTRDNWDERWQRR